MKAAMLEVVDTTRQVLDDMATRVCGKAKSENKGNAPQLRHHTPYRLVGTSRYLIRFWQSIVFTVVILALAGGARGGDPKLTEVLVVLPTNLELPPGNVLIYRAPDANNDWPTIQAELARDTENEIKVALPSGLYIAEFGTVTAGVLVMLRSPPFNVSKTNRVKLQAEKHSCGATISNKPAHLRQVALRRLGNGDVRWSAQNAPREVELVTSPGQTYVVSCIADLDQAYLAMWTRKETIKSPKLNFSDRNALHKIKFELREGTPALLSSQVNLYFPDTHFKIDDPTHAVFLTNRDRAFCDYILETSAQEKFYFNQGPCLFTKKSKIEIGGSFTPRMFAGFVWSENGGGWDSGALYTRVELIDADGRILDGSRSQPNLRTEMFFAPDQQQPEPLEGHMPGWSGFKSESVLAKVHYNYGGHSITTECRGEELVRVSSEHFSIATPTMWMFKARQYLSCLEMVRLLTIKNTGRSGPASFKVDWRSNTNNAKAIVGSPQGGGNDIWMSFPWWTFDAFWDPFTEPWFGNNDPYVCHEMLHTFGYNHGDELSHLEWLAEDQYRTLRWRTVDTGKWLVWPFPLRGE